jgi:hypothetical protein
MIKPVTWSNLRKAFATAVMVDGKEKLAEPDVVVVFALQGRADGTGFEVIGSEVRSRNADPGQIPPAAISALARWLIETRAGHALGALAGPLGAIAREAGAGVVESIGRTITESFGRRG